MNLTYFRAMAQSNILHESLITFGKTEVDRFGDNMHESVLQIIDHDMIDEGAIFSAIKKATGIKTSEDKMKEIYESEKPTPGKLNFRQAYQNSAFTWVKNIPKDDVMDFIAHFNAVLKAYYNVSNPNIMLATGKEFYTEYGLKAGDYESVEIGDWVIVASTDGVKNPIEFKSRYRARWFNDVVDNAVRIKMDFYSDKNYKPKPYIDMDSINAARQYLYSESTL